MDEEGLDDWTRISLIGAEEVVELADEGGVDGVLCTGVEDLGFFLLGGNHLAELSLEELQLLFGDMLLEMVRMGALTCR